MKSKLNFFYVNILCAARLGVIENLSVVSYSQVLHKTRFWKFIPERRHCQCGKEGIFLHVIISMMWSPYHVIVSVIIKSLSLRLRVTFFPPIPHRSGAMNSNLWNLKFCQVQSFVKAQNSKLSYDFWWNLWWERPSCRWKGRPGHWRFVILIPIKIMQTCFPVCLGHWDRSHEQSLHQ